MSKEEDEKLLEQFPIFKYMDFTELVGITLSKPHNDEEEAFIEAAKIAKRLREGS